MTRHLAIALLLATGCSGDGGASSPTTGSTEGTGSTGGSTTGVDPNLCDPEPAGERPALLGVTADWLGGCLSLVDLEALATAETRADALWTGIDVSAHPPGPIEVEVTPDGTTAVVAVGPGFFGGFVGGLIGVSDIPAGGSLLLVDLESRSISAVLTPAHAPLGIAIDPAGARAYTANYGEESVAGSTLTIVDLATMTIVEDVEVGPRPEQVALNDAGTLGVFNTAGDGAVRVFETADVAGSLSAPLPVSDDPSDVLFIPGTDYAVVASSIGPSTWIVFDVSDPAAPTIVEEAPPPGGIPYGVTLVPGTTAAILPVTDFDLLKIVRVELGSTPAVTEWTQEVDGANSFPLGIAIDAQARWGFMAAPGDDEMMVIDLADRSVNRVDWLDAAGPTYVALVP